MALGAVLAQRLLQLLCVEVFGGLLQQHGPSLVEAGGGLVCEAQAALQGRQLPVFADGLRVELAAVERGKQLARGVVFAAGQQQRNAQQGFRRQRLMQVLQQVQGGLGLVVVQQGLNDLVQRRRLVVFIELVEHLQGERLITLHKQRPGHLEQPQLAGIARQALGQLQGHLGFDGAEVGGAIDQRRVGVGDIKIVARAAAIGVGHKQRHEAGNGEHDDQQFHGSAFL